MSKKRIIALVTMIIGVVALVIGIVFLIIKLTSKPSIEDGEYLVSMKNWVLENENVVWDFTEIGKGTLTTNNHVNDYNFAWALKDGRLMIQTDWLYELNNEYDYELSQSDGILTLSDGEHEYKFVAQTE